MGQTCPKDDTNLEMAKKSGATHCVVSWLPKVLVACTAFLLGGFGKPFCVLQNLG